MNMVVGFFGTVENGWDAVLESWHVSPAASHDEFQSRRGGEGMIHFLVHDSTDNVGVAVVDLKPGTDCIGRNLADNSTLKARVEQEIPLGHKLA
jgi:hypothetical protein